MATPIRHILDVHSENRWSDLLAVLIEADPSRATALIGPVPCGAAVHVERESQAGGRDRVDLVVRLDGAVHAVVEVKVFSGLGLAQLDRYAAAVPANRYAFVHPQRLAVSVGPASVWQVVSWEQILDGFCSSPHPWVAETARAWRDHLDRAVPVVGGGTRWSELTEGEDFVVALRARMSWVYGRLSPTPPIEFDLVPSSAGVSWVARMWCQALRPGYYAMVEAEERLSVRDYPKWAGADRNGARGPSVKVVLLQTGVATSAGFDWDYLAAMWPLMAAARDDWVPNVPKHRAVHDRDNWKAMVAKGGPRHLGIGFGDAQARRSGACMFGARYQLSDQVRLQEVVDALHDTAQLLVDMSRVT